MQNNVRVRDSGRTCPLVCFWILTVQQLDTDQDCKEAEWFSSFPLSAFTKAKSWLTHTHTHSLFKAPSSLLLWWKNTVWCLFFFYCIRTALLLPWGRSEFRHKDAVAPRGGWWGLTDLLICVCFLAERRSLIGKVTVCFIFSLVSFFSVLPLHHSLSRSPSPTALPRWNVLIQRTAAPMMCKMSGDTAARVSASQASCLMFLADLQSAAESCTASLRLTAAGAFLHTSPHSPWSLQYTGSLTPMTRPQKSNCRDLKPLRDRQCSRI